MLQYNTDHQERVKILVNSLKQMSADLSAEEPQDKESGLSDQNIKNVDLDMFILGDIIYIQPDSGD